MQHDEADFLSAILSVPVSPAAIKRSLATLHASLDAESKFEPTAAMTPKLAAILADIREKSGANRPDKSRSRERKVISRFQANFFFRRRRASMLEKKKRVTSAQERDLGGITAAELFVDAWAYREWFAREGREPGWFDANNALRLARELHRSGDVPRPGIIASAARKLGGWTQAGLATLNQAVRSAWEKIVPKPDGLTRAMEQADANWRRFLKISGDNERVAKVAALAYYLSLARAGAWCAFPAVRIGKWLGLSHNRVAEALAKLEEAGHVIVQRLWSFKAKLAQQVMWRGPKPEPEECSDEQPATVSCGATCANDLTHTEHVHAPTPQRPTGRDYVHLEGWR